MQIKYTNKMRGEYPDKLFSKVYPVISINFPCDSTSPMFMINDEEFYYGCPILIEKERLEIIDASLPNFWSIEKLESGAYRIGPKEILGDFWDRFYDNEPEALETMEKIIKKTEDFHQKTKHL